MKKQGSATGTDQVALVPHSPEGTTEKEPPPAVCGQHAGWGVGWGVRESPRQCVSHTCFCPCLLLEQCVWGDCRGWSAGTAEGAKERLG